MEQTLHFTFHPRSYYATPPFRMLFGFCKLLRGAVSKPLVNYMNICCIYIAKGDKDNCMDILYFSVVCFIQ